jgi:hydrogenase nickel incorporation protein HypA/HybF
MHELAVTHDILAIVLRHAEANAVRRVVSVRLNIGALSDLEATWIQRYFDYLSRDTVAEGATITVRRTPAIVRCEDCAIDFEVRIREVQEILCPDCAGKRCSLVSGDEYRVEDMEALG